MSLLRHHVTTDILEKILVEAAGIAIASRENLNSHLKPDGSIVTNGDLEVEAFLRDKLTKALPGSKFWGEEGAFEGDSSLGLWIVDPIDGTSNYTFGSPLWGISVALMVAEELVVGGVILPDLMEIYLASKGGGATKNGSQLPQMESGVILPSQLVSYGDGLIRQLPDVKWPGKMRMSGAFVIDGTFVASGRFRALIGYRERLYDIAACLVINGEVGGQIRYLDGDPLHESQLLRTDQIRKPWVIFPGGETFTA